jgi:uncharacterized protein
MTFIKPGHIKWILAAIGTAGAAGLLLDAWVLEKYFFEIKSYNIGEESGKSIKLVLITDLHFKNTVLPQYQKLAKKLNQLKPDLLLITGDTIDSTGRIEPVQQFFDMLDPEMKKIAIPGNNDYRAHPSIEELKKVLEAHNCDFLVNESKSYNIRGARIMITGLDDLIEGDSCFKDAIKDVNRENHHFLLIHSPLQQVSVKKEIYEINKQRPPSEQLNISYIFAGHTHGGQVRIPGYVPVLPKKSGNYVNGWYNSSLPYLYVSRGFGTSTVPFRFFAKSEVTVFNYYV